MQFDVIFVVVLAFEASIEERKRSELGPSPTGKWSLSCVLYVCMSACMYVYMYLLDAFMYACMYVLHVRILNM